jgi:ribose transport system permease protein
MTRLRDSLGLVAVLVILVALFGLLSDHFFSRLTFTTLANQVPALTVVAVGMTLVLVAAGIDLSVGSVLAVAGIALALALEGGVPAPAAIALALATGTACGLANGVLITFGRLPPFIATLGMMSVARGAALMLAEGRPISGFSEGFRALATARIVMVPAPVLLTAVVYLVAHFVLVRTVFGRATYAIGGNEEAARLSGVHVRFHKTAVYGVAGLTSAVAAILLTARLNSAQPTAGTMYELDAIAATVIGGTSLLGGEGTLVGALIGALIMGVLRNGLNLLNVSSFFQQVVIGAVIIGAVLIDMSLKRRR